MLELIFFHVYFLFLLLYSDYIVSISIINIYEKKIER